MIKEFKNGLTVSELKELIADWPEVREDGTPTEVILGDGNGYGNAATEVSTVDMDEDGSADLFISHSYKG